MKHIINMGSDKIKDYLTTNIFAVIYFHHEGHEETRRRKNITLYI